MHGFSCRPAFTQFDIDVLSVALKRVLFSMFGERIGNDREPDVSSIARHVIEHDRHVLHTVAQHAAGNDCSRQYDAMHMPLVATAIVQACRDFLPGKAAFVESDSVEPLERKRRWQECIGRAIGKPWPAQVYLLGAPCIVFVRAYRKSVRAATEHDGIAVDMDGMQLKCCCAGEHARRQCLQRQFRAKHEPAQRISKRRGTASAQHQQKTLLVQSREMKQGTHAPLGIQPGIELPAADGEFGDVAAELGLCESDRVGTVDEQGFGLV